MHSYSTNESRVGVYGVFAVLSVVLAWLISTLTESLEWPQWLVSAPSVVGVFAALYTVFNRWLWRIKVIQNMGLGVMPDLTGIYEGKLTSNFKDAAGENVVRDIKIEIQQTWTAMSVEMDVTSGTSSSRSISAVGSVSRDGTSTKLVYVYRNKVNPGIADDDMQDHEGTADLRIKTDGRLDGTYFNDRLRKGTIQARKNG